MRIKNMALRGYVLPFVMMGLLVFSCDDSEDTTGDNATEQATEETTDEETSDSTDQTTDNSTEDTTDETTEETTDETTEDTTDETTDELEEVMVDFSASTTEIQDGQTVTFTNTSTGDADTWLWTFEGGTPATSSEQNPPAITYSITGSFDVTLVASRSSDDSEDTEEKVDFVTVTSSTGNLLTGNVGAEISDLSQWEAIRTTDMMDRLSQLSISDERSSTGDYSYKYSYRDGDGVNSFTSNRLGFSGATFEVLETGVYTFSVDVYGDVLTDVQNDLVYNIEFYDASNDTRVGEPAFSRHAADNWELGRNLSMTLSPGSYYVGIIMWNPPFDAGLELDFFFDNMSVVREAVD